MSEPAILPEGKFDATLLWQEAGDLDRGGPLGSCNRGLSARSLLDLGAHAHPPGRQRFEQQSLLVEQGPPVQFVPVAQQAPRQQTFEQQSLLVVQTSLAGRQLTQVWGLARSSQRCEQQALLLLQVPPLGVQGVTHVPLWQTWPEGQGQILLQAGAGGHVHFSPLAQYPLQHWLFVSQP
jgi:hypothetical protein